MLELELKIISDVYGGSNTLPIDHEEGRVFHSVLKSLSDLPDSIRSRVFPDGFDSIPSTWKRYGLDSRQARELSERLRAEAFASAATGEIPVQLEDEDSAIMPDYVMTLAALLDHLAARLGPGQRVLFDSGES